MGSLENRPGTKIGNAREAITYGRRNFLTKGFIGSALVFSGAAGISNTTTELAIEYNKQIPLGLVRLAEETPSGVVTAANAIDDIPNAVKNGAHYLSDEITSTGIKNKTCITADEDSMWVVQSREFELPFIEGNLPCNKLHVNLYFPVPGKNINSAEIDTSQEVPLNINIYKVNKETSSSNQRLSELAFKTMLLAAGTTIYNRSADKTQPITRRKLLHKIAGGAVTGILFTGASAIKKIV